jgi:hypothetical protein
MGGESSYTELLTCLEMARDVRVMRAEASGPSRRSTTRQRGQHSLKQAPLARGQTQIRHRHPRRLRRHHQPQRRTRLTSARILKLRRRGRSLNLRRPTHKARRFRKYQPDASSPMPRPR